MTINNKKIRLFLDILTLPECLTVLDWSCFFIGSEDTYLDIRDMLVADTAEYSIVELYCTWTAVCLQFVTEHRRSETIYSTTK